MEKEPKLMVTNLPSEVRFRVYIKFINVIKNMHNTMGRTTIAVKEETRDTLKVLGRKGESYDQIIERLLSISKEELDLIDEVYKRIQETDRKEYVKLEDV